MNPRHALSILRKDLMLGPRSPVFLYAIVFPVLATVLIQLVFGTLFDRNPRLGIVDEGDSRIVAAARAVPNVDVEPVDTRRELLLKLESHDLDAGLVLPQGFDRAVSNGAWPPLQLSFSGESLASDRVVLGVLVADLVRGLLPPTGEIDVAVRSVRGDRAAPLSERLTPLLVMLAVLIAGLFVPAASLVEEKERRTLSAVLVTPVGTNDVLAAKGALGLILAMAAGLCTLGLNRAFGGRPAELTLVVAVATLMVIQVGLIVGCLARDGNALLSVVKAGNIFLMAPTLFFIWPDLPGWVARIFPTYYFLHPLYQVAFAGAGLPDIWRELAVASLISVLLAPLVLLAGRRMAIRLAGA